jgi:hypothetical protein
MHDRAFLAAFEATTLSSEHWTHRAHLRVAFLYLRDLGFDEALVRIRSGIRALNRSNAVEDTPTSGYHETLTVAWARIVASAITPACSEDFEAFALSNPRLLAKDLLRAHYSKERLLSPEARASFVEPDLGPLPDQGSRAMTLPAPRGRMFQDEAFHVDDLAGAVVERLLGLVTDPERGPFLFLLKLRDRPWQRFYLDLGIGFWEEWADDVIDDDLSDTEQVDFGANLQLAGATVQSVVCEAGPRLALTLSCGVFVIESEDPRDLDARTVVAYRTGAS